jgi:hypothetical protein
MFRTHEETERIRKELSKLDVRPRVGRALYCGRAVYLADTTDLPNGSRTYSTGNKVFNTLESALDRIDAERPDEEVLAELIDPARGGYRPDEVAEIGRKLIAFGRLSGRRALDRSLTAALSGEAPSEGVPAHVPPDVPTDRIGGLWKRPTEGY